MLFYGSALKAEGHFSGSWIKCSTGYAASRTSSINRTKTLHPKDERVNFGRIGSLDFPTLAESRSGRHSLVTNKRTVSSVTEFNRQTGCFEYYGMMNKGRSISGHPSLADLMRNLGETSNFVVASSLGKRLNRLIEDDDDDDDADDGNPSSSSSRQKEPQQQGSQVTQERGGSSIDIPGLQTFIDAYDYVMPLNTPIRRYRCLQPEVADRHLDTFFATIHTYFPIFDVPAFRARYARLRELFGSNLLYAASGGERSPGQQQSLCLLYAVLALGALYDDNEDSSSWAAWYFSEAQELLGRLFDAVNLQLVQAGMFMVRIAL